MKRLKSWKSSERSKFLTSGRHNLSTLTFFYPKNQFFHACVPVVNYCKMDLLLESSFCVKVAKNAVRHWVTTKSKLFQKRDRKKNWQYVASFDRFLINNWTKLFISKCFRTFDLDLNALGVTCQACMVEGEVSFQYIIIVPSSDDGWGGDWVSFHFSVNSMKLFRLQNVFELTSFICYVLFAYPTTAASTWKALR